MYREIMCVFQFRFGQCVNERPVLVRRFCLALMKANILPSVSWSPVSGIDVEEGPAADKALKFIHLNS